MKYSDYFHARGVRTVSFVFGCFAGIPIALFTNWQYGVLSGAIVALLASFILPWRLYRADLPYARVKETLEAPFLIDERVRFTVKGGTVGGFFILTKDSIVLLSLENGDHRLELSHDDVKSVTMGENMTISIFLNDKQFVRVISGGCREMYDILRENGWTAAY